MLSAIKPFFSMIFPGGRQRKPLHREPHLDPGILRDVELVVVVDESKVVDRSVAGQYENAQYKRNQQLFSSVLTGTISFHSSIPSVFPYFGKPEKVILE